MNGRKSARRRRAGGGIPGMGREDVPDLQLAVEKRENARLMREAKEFRERLAELGRKASFYDSVMGGCDAVPIGDAAGKLGVPGYGRDMLFKFMRHFGIIDGRNVPRQRFVDEGYFRVVESGYCLPDGGMKKVVTPFVLKEGLDFLRRQVVLFGDMVPGSRTDGEG